MEKKIGIVTFHNSYNCGSMLESYAMQKVIENLGFKCEIIDYSNPRQQKMYYHWYEMNSFKNIIKNTIIFPHIKKIKNNNNKYEEFKKTYFNLSKKMEKIEDINEIEYSTIVSGSDQIWNITIDDFDRFYFLNWVKDARRVAYAPSFGAKKIKDFTNDVDYEEYCNLLKNYDALSIRENNGKKWVKEMINKDIPTLIDPTLLLSRDDYEKIMDNSFVNEKYIFYYNPSYSKNACEFVKKISEKYGLKVLCWSARNYLIKDVKKYGFELVDYESPAAYLNYIKNAELVITGSFHGTIFSTIFNKKFYSIYDKTYGNDDRLLTLVNELGISSNYTDCIFDDKIDYLKEIDYADYYKKLNALQKEAVDYLKKNLK